MRSQIGHFFLVHSIEARIFTPTLLDKLTGYNLERVATGLVQSLSLEEIKDSVARDLEALLNTRSVFTGEHMVKYPFCEESILTFGLCDFAGLSLASADDRTYICQSLERGIMRHERRLKNVKAVLDHLDGSINRLCFSISAVLVFQASKEIVSFDAFLQPSTLKYSIRKSRSAQQARP